MIYLLPVIRYTMQMMPFNLSVCAADNVLNSRSSAIPRMSRPLPKKLVEKIGFCEISLYILVSEQSKIP